MKLLKFIIPVALFIQILLTNVSGQIVIQVPTEEIENPYLLCGYIKSGELAIPSYKFKVTDKDGIILKNLRTKGELTIVEYAWTSAGIFDMDPYWKPKYHSIEIPVIYDSKEDIYISQEVPKINVAERKTGSFLSKSKCLDKITKLTFSFYTNDEDYRNSKDSFYFIFHFNNTTINKITLPDSQKVINLNRKSP